MIKTAHLNKKTDLQRLTLEELSLCHWLPYKRRRVKASTLSTYSINLHTHILPYLGKKLVCELDPDELNDFILEHMKNGRTRGQHPLSAKTIHEITLLLRQLLQFAVHRGVPVDMRVLDELISTAVPVPEIRILTAVEEKRLYEYLTANLSPCALGALLMLYTGIRLGELCALRWSDIDLEANTVSITKTMQRIRNLDPASPAKTVVIVDTPKSLKSIRSIPLPDFLLEPLRLYRSAASPDAFFLTGHPLRFIEPRTYRSRFERYQLDTGLLDIHVHALRHTFATRCVEVGFDIKTLSEILGHSSVKITLDRYVHSSFIKKRAEMRKIKPAV